MAIPARIVPHLAAICILLAAAATAVLPTRQGDFLNGDDQRFIIEHGLVNRPSWNHAATLLTVVHQDLYQPIPMLSFMANYALAAPTPDAQFPVSALNFKLTNIALHGINVLLVYWLILLVANCRRIAFITTLLFAIHPYVIEPVGWICGRMILLGTLFSLITLIACLRPSGILSRGAAWTAVLAWLLSLLSKIIPTVPVAGAWLAWRRHGRLSRREGILHGVLLVLAGAGMVAALLTTDKLGMIELAEKELSTPAPVRLLLASRYYFENFLWPSRIAAWSPPPENVALVSVPVFIALLEWTALAVLIWIAARRCPLAFTGLVAFVILMAPFLAATFARRFLTADRYMYLPMVGLHLALAAVMIQLLDGLRTQRRPTGLLALAATPFFGLAVVWLLADQRLAPTWRSTVARDLHMVAINPENVDAHAELAKACIFENRIDEALRVIALARRKWPDSPRLALQAGIAYRFQRDWTAAERELESAAQQMPNNLRVQYYYARTLEMVGKEAEATAIYSKVLNENPDYVPVLMALGDFHFFKSGNLQIAQSCYERAIAVSPFQRDAIYQLVMIAVRRADWPVVVKRCRQILDLNPNDRPALLNLGVALTNLGQPAEAMAIYDRLLNVEPSARAPRLNRAALHAAQRQFTPAESDYRELLRLNPADRDARIGLHDLLAGLGRGDDLLSLWNTAPLAAFTAPERQAWLAWAQAVRGDLAACRAQREALLETTEHRRFADWAAVWLALKSGKDADLIELLGPPAAISMSDAQRQYIVSAKAMLASLPPDQANSPAGHYALARLLYYSHDATAAKSVAEKLAARPDAGRYAAAARDFIAALSMPD